MDRPNDRVIALWPPVAGQLVGEHKDVLGHELMASAPMDGDTVGIAVAEGIEEGGRHAVAREFVEDDGCLSIVSVPVEARAFGVGHVINGPKHSGKGPGSSSLASPRRTDEHKDIHHMVPFRRFQSTVFNRKLRKLEHMLEVRVKEVNERSVGIKGCFECCKVGALALLSRYWLAEGIGAANTPSLLFGLRGLGAVSNCLFLRAFHVFKVSLFEAHKLLERGEALSGRELGVTLEVSGACGPYFLLVDAVDAVDP